MDLADLTPEQIAELKNMNKAFVVVGKPQTNSRKYQLNINIVRMEDVGLVGTGSVNPFIAVKVGNNLLKTPTISNSQKPEFNCRLKFPVTIPAQNDQIVMKAWDEVKLMNDNFIANIPESPVLQNFFSLSYLQQDKHMPFTWINLYSVPRQERQS